MEMTLQVNGMTCGHCEKAVKGALGELEGIQGVDVDLASGKVDVVYDDSLVTKNEMKEAIEEQGYDVVA
ncbi:copper chaperone CopZ [Terribacillus saccharophilus]|uniref:Copper chaperone CopZ n=1 Tax=Terribacillus saccharophilus TaxID=361277 RepID=A0A075LQC8_9BACI|nr:MULTISPECIES: copper chaperone CopZ [Terribacillus]AIF68187.1 copper-binding protein [Terribacillus goriensis]MCM3226364.1 copper chaperone CopZ [Terribacillus saccharophilus]MEC0282383.1 copper chaperone CopZ [Terribacillus saccharophilus]MEC0288858.1 copper chaperone CopZ [Terribacillus saccharophilus]SEN17869.1 copper chaperone [Terribacillus saccharophilus]